MTNEFDRGAADMGQRLIQDLITDHWHEIFVGTRRVIPFWDVVQFPNTPIKGLKLSFSLDYITATYDNENYIISFKIDDKTQKPVDFLFSSNWSNNPALISGVHKAFLNHLLSLTRIGAA